MSTSSWSTIPKELLCMILEERVETRDLLQLQRVCKNWSLVAYQQLYRHIKLNKRKWFLLLAHTLEHSQYQPKFHVKAIEPKYRIYKRTQATELDRLYTLVPLCPNLTHIIIDEEMVSDELYLQLMELHQQRGCLQHLQHLPDYDYHQAPLFRDSYNEAALAMKNTLTRLNIVNAFKHTLITAQHDEAPEIDMLTQLQKFPKLQVLHTVFAAGIFF